MIPIPQDDATQQRMLGEVEASVEDFRGVAGFSVLRTEKPGSAIGAHGGIQDDVQLDRVLTRMRMQPTGAFGGKLIIVCTTPERRWRIARLSGIRGIAPRFVDDRVFTDEHAAQAEIFAMRLAQYPAEDGMPEHYTPAWKARGENWGA
ncbi:MAG: N,N-dimethylformamidase, small subunit [Mycobacterium sp.]